MISKNGHHVGRANQEETGERKIRREWEGEGKTPSLSFQNKFIPVAAPDRMSEIWPNVPQVKEVRVHSSTELGEWFGWADQLTLVFDR